jgi:hypothetical protein
MNLSLKLRLSPSQFPFGHSGRSVLYCWLKSLSTKSGSHHCSYQWVAPAPNQWAGPPILPNWENPSLYLLTVNFENMAADNFDHATRLKGEFTDHFASEWVSNLYLWGKFFLWKDKIWLSQPARLKDFFVLPHHTYFLHLNPLEG